LENAASSFGENDRRTQNWQIALNKAQAELIGMERELKGNNDLLSKLAKEQEAAGRASGGMDYLGHTVSMKMTHRSYKDKRVIDKSQEEWIITKDTQPPIVDEETWHTAQRIRENGKRRYTSHGEMGPLNGLLYCSDCGAKLHISRARTIKSEHEYYSCSKYRNKFECSSHRIYRVALEQLILEDIRRVTAFAKEREAEFTALVEGQMRKAEDNALREAQAEYTRATARANEIDRIINGLYEDKVRGLLPVERFAKMLAEFETEQQGLRSRAAELKLTLDNEDEKARSVNRFLALVRRYTDMSELTGEIAATFIDRIIVGPLERVDGKKHQFVRILYNIVGEVASEQQVHK